MYLNWKKRPEAYLVCDTETDGFNPSKFWCAATINLGTHEKKTFNPTEMYDGTFRRCVLEHLDKGGYFIGHNWISFDSYHLRRLNIVDTPLSSSLDSLVLSYLYNPHLPGGHSLEAYGERLDHKKLGHDEWDHYSPEMLARCTRDAEINVLTYKALCDRMNRVGYSELSCEIEHKIRHVVDKQERNGFRFAYERASDLCSVLRRELTDLAEPIRTLFPPVLAPIKSYPFKRTAAGVPYASYRRHVQEYDALKWQGEEETDGSIYTTYAFKEFDIASPQQRIGKLESLGWEPTQFNKDRKDKDGKTIPGNPKIDEDALRAFAETSDRPEIRAIADWLIRNSRLSTVESWMKCYNPVTECIHGRVFTCGAASRRMTHNSPNTANIPSEANGAWLADECRKLWRAREGRKLVGYDASGLEGRGFVHYLGDLSPADKDSIYSAYIHGKPHQINSEALTATLGFPVVYGGGGAKTLFYAFLYGAQDPKLGSILKEGRAVGAKVRETLMKTIPGLRRAVKDAQDEWHGNGGRLTTIDGGSVICPGPHAALNYKIQPAGAIAMKMAAILLDEEVTKQGLDSLKCCDVHDEAQHDTAIEQTEAFGKLAVECIRRAGEQLGFKVPLDGAYKIGDDWSMTH